MVAFSVFVALMLILISSSVIVNLRLHAHDLRQVHARRKEHFPHAHRITRSAYSERHDDSASLSMSGDHALRRNILFGVGVTLALTLLLTVFLTTHA